MILPKHDRVVLWGLADTTGDSFQHIWRHYAHALARLDKPCLWVPDETESREWVRPGDLVFAVDVASRDLGAPIDRVDYLLHNVMDDHPVRQDLDPERCVYLQVWTNACAERGESWGPVRRWDKHSRTLYQPWGTNLLPDEFLPPVFNPDSLSVPFVGSVWDGNGQGNVNEIQKLKKAVGKRGLFFEHHGGVSDERNEQIVRESRFAPAIAGAWQVEHDYLPCRVFKNVSYGQLAVTNVPSFLNGLLGTVTTSLDGAPSIQTIVDLALGVEEKHWLDEVRAQQEIVREHYTYETSLEMIGRAFDS